MENNPETSGINQYYDMYTETSTTSIVSKDTGVGDPRGASVEKGKKFAEAVAEKYAKLFDELVNQELY